MIRIRIDVVLIDEKALQIIRSQAVDGICDISLAALAALIGCHLKTAHRVVLRLEQAGHIRRVGQWGHQMYEVLPCD